jgi:predicted flap endonuclease-1-like 5' DNA nuclease
MTIEDRQKAAAAIADIEGIGAVFAEKLQAAGVRTTDDLLEQGRTRSGRERLAAATGMTTERILEWVNRADLYRIKGVGSEYSDLLEASGVDTVVELAQRNAANLAAALEKTAADKPRIVRRVPSEKEVADWIDQAKGLPRLIDY